MTRARIMKYSSQRNCHGELFDFHKIAYYTDLISIQNSQSSQVRTRLTIADWIVDSSSSLLHCIVHTITCNFSYRVSALIVWYKILNSVSKEFLWFWEWDGKFPIPYSLPTAWICEVNTSISNFAFNDWLPITATTFCFLLLII